MDLSVIIPCHNLEGYIDKLLKSIEIQKYEPYKVEVIFVLDYCTDNTADLVKSWVHYHTSLSPLVIETDVRACGLARNKGLDCAQGKYIWFLDGDDWLLTNTAFYDVISWIEFQETPYVKVDYEYNQSFHVPGYYSMVWQYIFSREAIGDLRFSNIQPNEDREFMDVIIKKYGLAPYMKKKLYYYNFGREGSNMQQFLSKGHIDL